ncbi:hypothetical protein LTR82_000788 [Friedmanniomyces endolithicus]|uniref:Uncharacterized protein n=1 Tax=Friedmanniomyces endolithicus TaxID=329885 RepID=A0AAN6G2G6_9PEZI|nr:hypothetical protein LTR82_000788 [Friedmanniomyces endolithicus]
MADIEPTPPPRTMTTSSNTPAPPTNSARPRPSQRQSTMPSLATVPELPTRPPSSNRMPSPQSPDFLRRRSSILSDATNFTEDLIDPSARRRRQTPEDEEVTHWHSTPLAFALLPALGGILFKNGSAFTTDVLLLALAAVFMNWSIRIPWDWYYSAQRVRRDVEVDMDSASDELDGSDETAVDTASSAEDSPLRLPADGKDTTGISKTGSRKRVEAAANLRRQETLGLLSTFICPALAAYLLHIIRAQLSRPSTGLVSDYNLSIFLLAAELRPARQLGRLITNRTLHLQRLVNNADDVFSSSASDNSTIHSLTTRLAALEAKLSDHALVPSTTALAQKTDVTDLSTEMRKRYEPRLEGLERAVRRYEKRSTTLAMLTEQRLNSLDSRLQDALSLAAVAAQHSQRRAGVFAYLLETATVAIALPMRLAWTVCVWPFVILEDMYERVKALMLGPAAPSLSKGSGGKRRGVAKEGSADEKPRVKSAMRRVVR